MKQIITSLLMFLLLFASCTTEKNVFHSYYEFYSAEDATNFCAEHPDKYVNGKLEKYCGAKVINVIPRNDKVMYVVEIASAEISYFPTFIEYEHTEVVTSVNYNNKTNNFIITINDGTTNNGGFPNVITKALPIDSNSSFEEVMSYIKSNYNTKTKTSIRLSKNFRNKFPQIANQKTYTIN